MCLFTVSEMRLIDLIGIFLWIHSLDLCHAVKCALSSPTILKPLYGPDDAKSRLIFTNKSRQDSHIPISLNPSSYYDFICNSEFFVDNSMLIKYLYDKRHHAILLPRGFGKSLNLLMLKCFYEIPVNCVDKKCTPVPREETEAYQIFQNGSLSCGNRLVKVESDLEIKSWHLFSKIINQRPVLYITFQRTKNATLEFDEIYLFIIERIKDTYSHHRYLSFSHHGELVFDEYLNKLEFPPKDRLSQKYLIMNAVGNLADMLKSYFNETVMLLIDEYDSILNAAFLSVNQAPHHDKEELTVFFANFYNCFLKDNDCISQVVFTGVIPWNGDRFFGTSHHCIVTSTVVQDYPTYFYGISDTDLRAMYEGLFNTFENSSDLIHSFREHYDGYLFGKLNRKRYNLVSLGNYFKRPYGLAERELRPYWGETEDVAGFLHQLLKYSNFGASFLALFFTDGITEIKFSERYESRYLLSLKRMTIVSDYIDRAAKLQPPEWYSASMPNDVKQLVFSFLYLTGYLTKTEKNTHILLVLRISNREVREILWGAYSKILGNRQTPRDNSQCQRAAEAFVPYLNEIITIENTTECSNLNKYFHLFLKELPHFEKKCDDEDPHRYGNEAQIETIFSSVLIWRFDFISKETQHHFRSPSYPPKQLELCDENRITKRPDLTLIYERKLMTVFEFKFDDDDFDAAYVQALKYVHFYFLREEYNDVDRIKLIPFIVSASKIAISNATICTRDQYLTVEKVNSPIRNDLKNLRKSAGISSECNETCYSMFDWTLWNFVAKPCEFDHWKQRVLANCGTWLTPEMSFFDPADPK